MKWYSILVPQFNERVRPTTKLSKVVDCKDNFMTDSFFRVTLMHVQLINSFLLILFFTF